MNMHSRQELERRCARLHQFLANDRENLELACDLIDALLLLGKHDEADRILVQAEEFHRNEAALRFRKASILLARGDFVACSDLLQALRDTGIDNPGIRYNHALARLCIGDAASAADILRPVLDNWQEYPPVLLLAARSNHALRDYPVARSQIQTYLEHDPGNIEATALLSLLLVDAGEPEAALEQANKALADDPLRLEALLAAAGACIQLDDCKTAAEHAQTATRHYPDSGRAWSLLAQVHLDNMDMQQARMALGHATKYMPDHIGTWHMLAWLDILENDFDKAIESFEASADIDRSFDETHGGIAVVHALRENWDEARESCRRALKLNPQSYSGRYAKSLLLAHDGDTKAARQLIDDILTGTPPAGTVPLADIVRARIAEFEKNNPGKTQ